MMKIQNKGRTQSVTRSLLELEIEKEESRINLYVKQNKLLRTYFERIFIAWSTVNTGFAYIFYQTGNLSFWLAAFLGSIVVSSVFIIPAWLNEKLNISKWNKAISRLNELKLLEQKYK